jgi:hypothetical protein
MNRMRRREFIAALAAAIAAGQARVEEPAKPARVDVVYFGARTNESKDQGGGVQ